MRSLSENGNKRAAKVLRITEQSGKMLSAILIGNNIVNLSASSLMTTLAIRAFGSFAAGIATGILTALILVFGEIIPKTLATLYADSISMAYSGSIHLLMHLLTPLIWLVDHISVFFLRILQIDAGKQKRLMTEKELRTILAVSQEDGVIETEERQMIYNVFDFGDTYAKDIMVPRIDMTFLDVQSSYPELLALFKEYKYTRFPVYEGSTDNVIGILNIKDVFLDHGTDPSLKKSFSIRDYIRDAYFTYEHKNTAELFLEMKNSSINIAIVLDEYGATAGLLTLEDLLEEIVGEIRDEYDYDEEDSIHKISDHDFIVDGSARLDDLNELLPVSLTSENYDSINGYLMELCRHLPKSGEKITSPDGLLHFEILRMKKRRIEKIRIRFLGDPVPTD